MILKEVKMITKIFIIMAICIAVPLYASDGYDVDFDSALFFNVPNINPTLSGLFTSSINSINVKIIEYEKHHFWSAYYNFDSVAGGNVFTAVPIKLYKSHDINFAMPLFIEFVGNNSGYDDYEFIRPGNEGTTSDRQYSGLMLGGGLMYYGKYGLLAGYIGYSWEWGRDYDYEWSENKIRWAVSPIINVNELPILNSFIRLIDGFFCMDNLQMDRNEFKPTYKANVLFKSIGAFTFSAYTQKDWYNSDAKYNIYGGKLDIGNETIMFRIGGGYREFFDVFQSSRAFEDGIYAKISLNWLPVNILGLSFFIESGSTPLFKDPTYGFVLSMAFKMTNGLFSWSSPCKVGGFNQVKKNTDMFDWGMGANMDFYIYDWDHF
jgi:hypothetical protein